MRKLLVVWLVATAVVSCAQDPGSVFAASEKATELLEETVAEVLATHSYVLDIAGPTSAWCDEPDGTPDRTRIAVDLELTFDPQPGDDPVAMAARIVAVVDSYVGRTAGSHGDPQDPGTALAELVRGAGHEFDPEVVEAFHRVMDKRLAGRKSKKKPVVLVMEPDEEFRRLLKMRLLNDGLAVEEATTYEGALERLLKEPPALAMILMPFSAASGRMRSSILMKSEAYPALGFRLLSFCMMLIVTSAR